MEGFSFVDESVAGMPMPSAGDIDFLRQKGITAIVGLKEQQVSEEELNGIRYIHMPIPDFEAPLSSLQKEFVDEVTKEVQNGGKVAVHCKAGKGRTGTMLATWLVSQGMSAEDAISHVRETRPGSIETSEQLETVHTFERESSK